VILKKPLHFIVKVVISIKINLKFTISIYCIDFLTVSLLKDLKHANIVTLHDIIHTDTTLTLVFEYLVSFFFIFVTNRFLGDLPLIRLTECKESCFTMCSKKVIKLSRPYEFNLSEILPVKCKFFRGSILI